MPDAAVKIVGVLGVVCIMLIGISCDGRGNKNAPEFSWGVSGRGPSELSYPRVITFDDKSNLFALIDRTARVQIFDSTGHLKAGWTMPEQANGKPVGATFAPDGTLWVADTHYHRIIVYDLSGKLLRTFGKKGTGTGVSAAEVEFDLPCDIAFEETTGRYFISEYGGNDRIQVFESDGRFVMTIGRFGQEPGEFSRPQSIAIRKGELFVADSCNHRISVFDTSTGKHLRDLGSVGTRPGELRFPYGLVINEAGAIVVTEFANARVQWLDPLTGKSLRVWGAAGKRSGELAFPWSLDMDSEGKVFVLDSGNDRIQVIGR